MASKKRTRVSRRAVQWRRERVLELRLAGLSPANIAEKLRKEGQFKHTTGDTVLNDIKALEERSKLERIEPEAIVKEIFQTSRDSMTVVSKAAHRRFMEISEEIGRVQEMIAEVDRLLQEPTQSANSRGQLMAEHDRLVSRASKLRRQARDETRVIVSMNKTLMNMPKKLGLILEREDVGLYDDMKETMIEAIKNEPDPDRRKELIEAAELLGGIA